MAHGTLLDKSINSAQNPVFRLLLECLTSKGIKKHGLFLASGEKVISDILDRHPARVRNLILCTDRHLDISGSEPRPTTQAIVDLAHKFRARSGAASTPGQQAEPKKNQTLTQMPELKPVALGFAKSLFDQLDLFGTGAPLLALNTFELAQASLTEAPRGLEIICALSDPSNVGALLRSAAAFKAARVILLKESASPFHPRAVRAASAATFSVNMLRGPSIKELPQLARQSTSPFFALDMFGEKIAGFDWPKDARLVIGEEGQGVPETEAFHALSIPISPGVESLNATVAASIALYAYRASHPL